MTSRVFLPEKKASSSAATDAAVEGPFFTERVTIV